MVCVLWGHAAVRCSLCRIGIICRLSQVLCNVTLCGNGEIEYCMRSNFLFRVDKGSRIGLSADTHAQGLRRLSLFGLGRENRGLKQLAYLWCGTSWNTQMMPVLLSVLLEGFVVKSELVVWLP